MTAPSARAELAAEIRAVNRVYSALDSEAQEQVAIVPIEPVEAALAGGDRDRALQAVASWSHRQLQAIREVAR